MEIEERDYAIDPVPGGFQLRLFKGGDEFLTERGGPHDFKRLKRAGALFVSEFTRVTVPSMDQYQPLLKTLSPFLEMQLAEIPNVLLTRHQRAALRFPFSWDRLIPEQRRLHIEAYDFKNDPANQKTRRQLWDAVEELSFYEGKEPATISEATQKRLRVAELKQEIHDIEAALLPNASAPDNNVDTKQNSRRNIWDEPGLRGLLMKSMAPGITHDQLAAEYGVSRQLIGRKIKEASKLVKPKKALTTDLLGWKNKK